MYMYDYIHTQLYDCLNCLSPHSVLAFPQRRETPNDSLKSARASLNMHWPSFSCQDLGCHKHP